MTNQWTNVEPPAANEWEQAYLHDNQQGHLQHMEKNACNLVAVFM